MKATESELAFRVGTERCRAWIRRPARPLPRPALVIALAGGVLVFGTSRGGLGALHIMAADERVVAGAVHAPLTCIAAPHEFAHLAGSDIVRRSSALGLVERLADRPVFMDIGMTDPRVGAEHAREFYAALRGVSHRNLPTLFTAPGQSHGETYPHEVGLQAAAGFLLSRYAEHMKADGGE